MEKRKTQVITGEVRFSYAHVWEPSSINGGDEKYSVSIIIPGAVGNKTLYVDVKDSEGNFKIKEGIGRGKRFQYHVRYLI